MESLIKKNKSTISFVALFLVVAPILDPYILFSTDGITLHILDLIMLITIGYLILRSKQILFPNKYLFVLLVLFFILNLVSFLQADGNRSFSLGLKVIFVWVIYAFSMGYLWRFNNYDKFMEYAKKIAIISTILLILQFIFVSIGYVDFFDGKIPFLQLSKYNAWASLVDVHTGDLRVHSFFEEPSYYGIYCLPVLAQALKQHNNKLAVFICIGLLISSSILAILGGFLVVLFVLFTYKNENGRVKYKIFIQIIVTLSIAAIVLTVLYNNNDNIKEIVDYSVRRISSINSDLQNERLGSTRQRLIGYANYFFKYPTYFKIFGAGINQYPVLLNLISYSSTIVTILLNYGLIGFVIFIFWLLKIYYRSNYDKRCFVLIFIMICFVDNFWYNWYFFYILSWFLPDLTKQKKQKIDIKEKLCRQ